MTYRPGMSIRDAIAAVRNGLNAGFLWAVREISGAVSMRLTGMSFLFC
jgi:hypothetical protein